MVKCSRARESLGYTVDMEWRDAEKLGIPGILVVIQSEQYSFTITLTKKTYIFRNTESNRYEL